MTDRRILRRLALAAAAVMAVLTMPPAAAAPELDDFEFLQNSTVRVVTQYRDRSTSFGTGWVAATADPRNANNAVIVTALHNVRGARSITVVEANSSASFEANVRATDDDRDIAFLEVRGLRNGGLALRVTPVVPPVGQELRTTGYAIASDQPSRREAAEISGVLLGAYSRTIPDPQPIGDADVGVAQFQHSINLSGGFSGGPVIDKCGRVVGFNLSNGGVRIPGLPFDPSPGISFAVASAEILKAAQDNGIRLTEDASPCPDPAAAAATAAAPSNTNEVGVAPAGEPWTQRLMSSLRGRTGLALIIGLLALVAIGVAAWLFFGKSGGSQSVVAPTVKPETTRVTVGATGPLDGGGSARTLTLSGRGAGGEPISLRFAADEIQERARSLGTEGQAHIPDHRAKTLVSRLHAEISFDGDQFYVQDLKSTNGSKLDGQELPPFDKRRLHDGATITLADVTLNAQID